METKNLTIVFLIGAVLAVVIATLHFNADKNTTNINSEPAFTVPTKTPPTLQNDESSPYSELTQQEINQLNFDSEADRKQRRYLEKKHNAERGYISLEEEKLYESYPGSALQEMGKNGDIHALRELGLRAAKERDYKLSFSYFESAAIYGSTITLGYLSSEYEMTNQLYLDSKNGKRALMGALAYLQVAELRGDYNNSDLIEKYLSNYSAHSSGTYDEVKLDENDLQKVEENARQIYETMEKRRIELGLGPFDNSIPEGSTAQLHKDMALREKARNN